MNGIKSSVITVNQNRPNTILSVLTITKNEIKDISGWFDDIDRQSIRNQIEVICCDSSTDGTEKIIMKRADKISHCDSCKFADARNECAALASSDLLFFTDVDIRYLTPTFLADAIKYFRDNHMNVGSIGTVLQPDGTLTHPASQNRLSGQFIMITREAFDKIGGFGKYLGVFNTWEDGDLTIKVRNKGYRIQAIPMTIKHLRPQKKWLVFW